MLIVLTGSYPPDSWIKNVGHPSESPIHSHYSNQCQDEVTWSLLGRVQSAYSKTRQQIRGKGLKKESSLETIKCLTADFVEHDSEDLQYIHNYIRVIFLISEKTQDQAYNRGEHNKQQLCHFVELLQRIKRRNCK